MIFLSLSWTGRTLGRSMPPHSSLLPCPCARPHPTKMYTLLARVFSRSSGSSGQQAGAAAASSPRSATTAAVVGASAATSAAASASVPRCVEPQFCMDGLEPTMFLALR